jgi:hypothetical protein
MVRRYDEPIEVRTSDRGESGDPAVPEFFLWRGRLFSVRAVQARWSERSSWWRDLGADPAPAVQREVWRVEASPGAGGIPGVFDLGSNGAPAGPGSAWLLLRTQD